MVWFMSYDIENIAPSVKHGGGKIKYISGSVMGPLVRVDGKMNHQDYIRILDENLLPLIQSDFNGKGYAFQDDNALCIQQKVLPIGLEKRKLKVYLIGRLNLPTLIQLNTFGMSLKGG